MLDHLVGKNTADRPRALIVRITPTRLTRARDTSSLASVDMHAWLVSIYERSTTLFFLRIELSTILELAFLARSYLLDTNCHAQILEVYVDPPKPTYFA